MKQNRLEQWIKRKIRETEAALNPSAASISYRSVPIKLQRSIFWQPNLIDNFLQEISPYHDALTQTGVTPKVIVDAGAAEGHFSVSSAVLFPEAKIYAFEPSARQRIMLARNAERNGVASRIEVIPKGLFDRTGSLAFRTAGAASFLEVVDEGHSEHPCFEQVPVVQLDEFLKGSTLKKIDLLKMDIEGAEIEALTGALDTLKESRPVCLIQAYHIREDKRTFERCADFLKSLGYETREWPAHSGMVVGTPLK